MADPAAPILLFDSGVGGLTVLAELRKLMPQAPVIYAADTAGLPYGEKTEAQVAARVAGLLGRLSERYSPRLITIACNTASTIALAHVRAALDLPIVGTVPAIKPAAVMTASGVIGVLGTEATVRQPYVDDLAARFAADCTVVRHGSARMVELAEAKLGGMRVTDEDVRDAIQPLLDSAPGMDVMVLACTHFPLLADEIAAAAPGVALVDGGPGIARRIAHLTEGQPWPDAAPPGRAGTPRSAASRRRGGAAASCTAPCRA